MREVQWRERLPLAALVEEAKKLLELEAMPLPTEDYISQILDAKAIKGKETRKKDLLEKLQKLRAESVDTLEAQMKEVQERRDAKQKEITKTEKEIWKNGKKSKNSETVLQSRNLHFLESRKNFRKTKGLKSSLKSIWKHRKAETIFI